MHKNIKNIITKFTPSTRGVTSFFSFCRSSLHQNTRGAASCSSRSSAHANTRGAALRNREAMGKGRSSGVEMLTLVTNTISFSLEKGRSSFTRFSGMKVVSLMMSVIFIFLTFSFITTTKTEAAPNYQMNYQGKLTNASNVAVADGTYNMRFWLLTSGSIATTSALWNESLTGANKVQVTNGLFSIMLGSTSPLTGVDFNQTLYLGVEIGGTSSPIWDGEMTPRKTLGTVPSAFEADKIDGLTSTQFVRTDATTTIATSSTDTLLTITQNGVGDILNLFDGTTEVFSVIDGGNVGIGTTSPSRKLTIQGGDAYIGGHLTATGTANFANLLVTGSSTIGGGTGATGLTINGTATTTNLTVTSLTASRAIFTDANNLLTTTGVSQYLIDALSDETGTGFAVFSASPTFTGTVLMSSLSASGSSTIGGGTGATGLTINGTATSTLGLIMSGTASNISLGSNYLSGDGGDEGIYVDASGNVGIGTSTPYAKLTIAGEALADYFTATGSTSTTTLMGGLNVGSGGLVYDYASGLTTIQNMAFGAMNFDSDAGIVTWVDMPVTTASATGTVMSYSANIAGTSTLTVYAESAGNGGAQNFRVGIGSSTPTRTLTVSGDGWFTGNITAASSTLGYASSTSFTTGSLRATASSTIGDGTGAGGLTINGTATTTNLKITSLSDGCLSTLSGLVTSSGSPCGSGGGSSNWLFDGTRLTPSTTVGIGIFASSTIGGGTGATGLTINGTATSTLGLIMSGTNSNISLGSNYLSGDGGDEGIYVDASGNVGIGTTTPSAQLTIANFAVSDTSAPFFSINASTTGNASSSYQNSFFRISYASSTEIFGKVIDPEFISEEQGTTPGTSLDDARSVFVSGNYAYVAALNRDSLAVIDISNPADPVFVSEEQGPIPGTSLDAAGSVFVSGNYAYVANVNRDSLAVIDISNPADPVFLSEERGPTPGTSFDGAHSVFVSGNYAYVANNARDSLAVIDISNPADPVFISEELGPTPGTSLDSARSVSVSGNYAYVAALNRDSLAVIDISNPADPIFLSEELGPTPGTSLDGARFVFVSGNYAYVAAELRDSLAIIDISNPADPVFISEELGPIPGTSLDAASSVFVSGNYAYAANQRSLAVIDVSNPADPVFISEELGPIPGTSLGAARSVFVSGNYAYVATQNRDSLAVIDIGGATISNLAVGTAKIGNLQVDSFAQFAQGALFGGGLGVQGNIFANGGGSFTRMGTTTPLASTTLSWGNTPTTPALSALIIDGASSGVSDVFSLSHLATSTSASAGIGTGILFNSSVVAGATTYATSTSRIASILTNVSSSTPQSVLTFANKNTAGVLTEFMRLDHLGYLGLGTTSPSRKLTVAGGDGWFGGNLTATGTATFANLLVTGSSTIGGGTGSTGLTINGTATTTNLKITSLSDGCLNVTSGLVASTGSACGSGGGGSSNWLFDGTRLTPSTTVGIGIFASSTIGGGTGATGLTINGTATSTLGLIMSGTASNISLGSNYLSGDGGDEGIYVDASGNVGIGTTTPSAQLTIANFAVSDTSAPFFSINASTTGNASSSYQNSFFRISYASSTEIFGKVIDPEFVAEEQGTTPGTTLDGANSVFVSGNYAYVANYNRDSLAVIDISNPADPVFVSEERGPISGTSLDGAFSVFVSGNYAYVANYGRASLAIIDISNPADPVFVSEERGPAPDTSLNGAWSVFVSGNYAYVANAGRHSLAVIDISNPADPVFVSEERGPISGTSLNGANSVFISGNYAYVSVWNRNSLAVIDISNPSDPVFVSEETGGGLLTAPFSVFVSGKYAYMTTKDRHSLAVIDISNPADPVFISEERGPVPGTSLAGALSVFVSGNYAYVVTQDRKSFAVIDISNPADPVFISEERGPNPGTSLNKPVSVFVQGNYAYVVNQIGDSLAVIDVGGATISNLAVGTAKIGNLQVDSFAQFAQNAYIAGSLGIGSGGLFSNGAGSFLKMGTTTPLASTTLSWGNTPTTPALSALIIDGASSGVSDVFSLSHLATSTAASAGIGTGILFNSSVVSGATTYATSTSRIASILTNVSSSTPQSILTFSNKNTSGSLTEFMRLDHNGNLGLGTTSPSRKLTIQGGDAYIGGNLTATGTAIFANLLVTGSSTIGGGTGATGLTINGTATTTNLKITALSDGCLNIASGLVASTGSACGSGGGSSNWLFDGTRLTPSTTVGIGIFASSTIGGGTGSTGLTINGTATSTLGLIMSGTNSNITLGSNYLSGDGGDEGIFVDASGNVGIGTTTSTARLTIQGTAGATASLLRTATSTGTTTFEVLASGDVEVANNLISKGITWKSASSTEANQWLSVTYGNGLFVSVAYSGTNRIMTSPDGMNWTTRIAPQVSQWRSVTYGNGMFVAVGPSSVMTSPDGITWTARTATEPSLWWGVTYGDGLFVAVSQSGTNRVMTSPDGITWTARSATEVNSWFAITYGNGLFVAVSADGTNRVMTSPDGITWTARSAAEVGAWTSITYGNGLFVAVNNNGTNRVMTSPDGITWIARTASEANQWYSVTYGNGLFVTVSIDGTNRVMTSPNGIIWTARKALVQNTWYAVTYGNGTFVATSFDGTNQVMTSGKSEFNQIATNNIYQGGMSILGGVFNIGTTTGTTSPFASNILNIASTSGSSLFTITGAGNVGIGTTSPSRKLTVQGGDGWFGGNLTATGTATFANLLVTGSSTIGGGTGSTGLTINGTATSTLGLIMSGTNSNITLGSNYLSGDGGDEGIFVDASGNVGIGTTTSTARLTIKGTAGATASLLRTATSTGTTTFEVLASGDVEVPNNLISKGITWTARSASEANVWTSVTYGNGLFVAVAETGTNRVMTSPDGITWTARSAAEASSWVSVTYGNGLFVAVAWNGTNRIMTSPDGITWTARSASEANTWVSITYGNGLFVAVACGIGTTCNATAGGNRVMTSPDGITWTARSASEANYWYSVTYGNGLFVAVAYTGTNRVMTSPNGITWTARSASEANQWRSITYGNGLFVAVAETGTNRVMTSPDGITWTARSASAANTWFAVTYGNGLFVAVAQGGTNRIMTSPDGITWTARSASEANSWYSVTYGNGLFVSVALDGTNPVMTSGKSEFNQIATNNIYQGGMSVLGGVFNIGTTTGTTSPFASNILNIASTSGSSLFTITGAGNVGIGTTSPSALLTIDKAGVSGSTVAGMKQYFGFTNATLSALYYGDETYIVNAPTATSTLVGKMIRIEDSTALGNTVRGFEAQAHRGTNTKGENTGISGYGRTFGVRGTTIGDAGDTFLPAGVFAESQGTTQGNALRAYSGTMTTEDLVSLFHDGSAFTGTGLQMNFGNTTGSFAATSTAKFLDLQVAGTSKFIISANGSTTLGDGIVNASLMIPRGGICVDNDGSCISTTTGEIRSVTSALGNSDLAEMYFSRDALEKGEIVSLSGGLSVTRASGASTSNIIGVVSTKPGMTLGFDDTSLSIGETAYPIGLKGRVPIQLSTENGAIKKGDRITLSSIAGVGMKAMASSRVVGIALEDYDGTRAYSAGYLNQFGDDMVKDRITEKTVIDPRTQDGCYNGGGNALGEASCTPEKVTKTTVTTVTDNTAYKTMLTTLTNEAPRMRTTPNGTEVTIGHALMFIELTNYQIADETTILQELTATSSLANNTSTDTLWSRLKGLAHNFVNGILTLTGLKADRVDVQNELCVDGVCMNASDLRALLNSVRGGNVSPAPTTGGSSNDTTTEIIGGSSGGGTGSTDTGTVDASGTIAPPPEEPPVTEESSPPEPESTNVSSNEEIEESPPPEAEPPQSEPSPPSVEVSGSPPP